MAQDPNNYWEQLERLEKLIKNSELKAGVVFSFHSLILGLFVDRLNDFRSIILENKVLLVITVLWIISVIISIIFCFICFKPVMELKYKTNVFFFKDAVNKFDTVEDYVKELTKVCGSEDEMYEALAEQIHVESKIINGKFINVNKSIVFFTLSIAFAFLFAFYYFIFV
ncbi:Pycsar system effector family protein [Winogradskyella tangerina]|uniref:Pycsar system effector family protein n=1 Tax=Winogradskyella tangerina TaxID=2023240 RepID=UPI000DBE21A2|nr:Pycsar system effector family protein [Winogradskyella tangerina]